MKQIQLATQWSKVKGKKGLNVELLEHLLKIFYNTALHRFLLSPEQDLGVIS